MFSFILNFVLLFFIITSLRDHQHRLLHADMKRFFSRPPTLPPLSSYPFYPTSFLSGSSVDSIHSPRPFLSPPISSAPSVSSVFTGKIPLSPRSYLTPSSFVYPFYISFFFFVDESLLSSISPHNPFLLFLLAGGLPSPVSPLNLSTAFTFARQLSGLMDSPSSPRDPDASLSPLVPVSSSQDPDASLSPLVPAKRLALRPRTPSPPSPYVPLSTAVGDIPPYVPTPLSSPVVRRLPAFPPLPDSSSSPTSADDPVPLSIDISVEPR